ncbi:hypothetical protein [Rhodococcus sp. HM1]|uniref:hypothetical protein n=1 Tax=Rhodococcus sp. HM1 TaxID=2937759 RepID=UPI00200B08F4|nr:hypothetical protein [Rhodococcus sp. HM1]
MIVPVVWTSATPAGKGKERGGYFMRVLNKIETVTVMVSAHRDDSYRKVEQCARRQWADVLAERGGQWSDAGLELVDRQPDTDIVGRLVYRFEGTIVEYAGRVSG